MKEQEKRRKQKMRKDSVFWETSIYYPKKERDHIIKMEKKSFSYPFSLFSTWLPFVANATRWH